MVAVDLDESLESLTARLNDVYVRLTRLRRFSDDMDADSKLAVLNVSIALQLLISLTSRFQVISVKGSISATVVKVMDSLLLNPL